MEKQELTNELLKTIKTNPKLRNAVAYAHGCSDAHGQHLGFKALAWPHEYMVSKEQIKKAEQQIKRDKKKAIESLGNKLVFVGMGMDYTPRYEDDVCNHRIRTEIINTEGRRFFIEVGTGRGDEMRIDYVVDRDQEGEYNSKAQEYRDKIEAAGGFWRIGKGHDLYEKYQQYMSQPYYWYKKEEWQNLKTKYTNKNVLDLVNSLFDCHFTEIEIDNYTLRTEDFASISPKK